MAFIPNHTIPGVYGPINYPVELIGDGIYYIRGYSLTEFRGTPEQIAEQIFKKFVNEPEVGIRTNYVGPFNLQFKPFRCRFVMNPDPSPPELDLDKLAEEISSKLARYEKLLPFI